MVNPRLVQKHLAKTAFLWNFRYVALLQLQPSAQREPLIHGYCNLCGGQPTDQLLMCQCYPVSASPGCTRMGCCGPSKAAGAPEASSRLLSRGRDVEHQVGDLPAGCSTRRSAVCRNNLATQHAGALIRCYSPRGRSVLQSELLGASTRHPAHAGVVCWLAC
jgi:hypothetical protein